MMAKMNKNAIASSSSSSLSLNFSHTAHILCRLHVDIGNKNCASRLGYIMPQGTNNNPVKREKDKNCNIQSIAKTHG